jgi:hypothetical protein
VLIADDEQMVRRGFRVILEAEQGISVVAEAGDGWEPSSWREHRQDPREPDLDEAGPARPGTGRRAGLRAGIRDPEDRP